MAQWVRAPADKMDLDAIYQTHTMDRKLPSDFHISTQNKCREQFLKIPS